MLSITDHDTVSAYRDLPSEIGLHLIPGVEFSSAWRNVDVHVVGLNIDPYSRDLALICGEQAERRLRRAEKIAKKLFAKKLIGSVDDALERVKKIAKGSTIGRPHFARYLVEIGRRKLIKPLYDKLVTTPEGRVRAAAIYERARPGYHPIAVASIDEVVRASE